MSDRVSATRAYEARARELLADLYKPEGIEIWLSSPHRHFHGEPAITLLHDGRHEEVFAEIERLLTGAFS